MTLEPKAKASIICLYHANCMDGLTAAAIVYRFFKGAAEFKAVSYGDKVPLDEMYGKHVYFVDFTFPPEEVMPYIDQFKTLTVIDHHHDAMVPWVDINLLGGQDKSENLTVIYSPHRSGATMVWEFFYSTVDAPLLVWYMQEYDLWTKELPKTDEVTAALRFRYPPKQANLKELSEFLVTKKDEDINELIKIGSYIVHKEKELGEALMNRLTTLADVLGYKGIPVCPVPPELVNVVGEMLYIRYPDAAFVIMYEDCHKHGSRKYSFRSRRNGGEDVSMIAKQFGGKGHYHSSGAKVTLLADPTILKNLLE